MKKFFPLILIILTSLGCSLTTTMSPGFKDTVSTQVSQELTSSPVSVSTFTLIPTLDSPNSSPVPKTTEPTRTTTITLTPTTTQTPTLSPDDPRTNLGTPDWKEDFSKTNNNFFKDEGDQYRFAYDNGSLVLTAIQPNGWTGWSLSYLKPKNFYLEATFDVGSCSGLDRYGLVFRAPNYENGYFFGFSCDGQYSLRIYDQPGTLIPWTPNPAILSGSNQVNRLGILALGDRYAFYANGKLLEETKESTFLEGGLFGAFVASSNTPNFTVRMDEISFWNK